MYLNQQQEIRPSIQDICQWSISIVSDMFPDFKRYQNHFFEFCSQKLYLVKIINSLQKNTDLSAQELSDKFFSKLPLIFQYLKKDLKAILFNDPAVKEQIQIIISYPGFKAICFYRISHQFYLLKCFLLSRIISEYAHSKTGIDIHAGATIGEYFRIDHGTGIVIGETAQIGNNVGIFHGVTLGSIAVNKSLQNKKRHPTIKDNVTIYSNASILGGETIIGQNSIIGGNVWITKSLPANSKVFYNPQIKIIPQIKKQSQSTLLNTIGNTPLVRITKFIKNPKVKLFAKLEDRNPSGSEKDRSSYNMILSALQKGQLKKGDILIQATQGRTAISLAMISKQLQINIELVMPEDTSKQRVQILNALGAKIIFTPAIQGIYGSRKYVQNKIKQQGRKSLNQINNKYNYLAHYNETGPQIYRDTLGQVTHFIAAINAAGTVIGCSKYLKQRKPNVQVIGVKPFQKFKQQIIQTSLVDKIIDVQKHKAQQMTRLLVSQQSILTGISSGAAVAAAIDFANQLQQGLIVVIITDRGDNFLSSRLSQAKL